MLNYLVIRLTARCRTQRGASAVEYALMVAGLAVVCLLAFKTLGVSLVAVFNTESSKVATPGTN